VILSSLLAKLIHPENGPLKQGLTVWSQNLITVRRPEKTAVSCEKLGLIICRSAPRASYGVTEKQGFSFQDGDPQKMLIPNKGC
jgi:hypothetical protein